MRPKLDVFTTLALAFLCPSVFAPSILVRGPTLFIDELRIGSHHLSIAALKTPESTIFENSQDAFYRGASEANLPTGNHLLAIRNLRSLANVWLTESHVGRRRFEIGCGTHVALASFEGLGDYDSDLILITKFNDASQIYAALKIARAGAGTPFLPVEYANGIDLRLLDKFRDLTVDELAQMMNLMVKDPLRIGIAKQLWSAARRHDFFSFTRISGDANSRIPERITPKVFVGAGDSAARRTYAKFYDFHNVDELEYLEDSLFWTDQDSVPRTDELLAALHPDHERAQIRALNIVPLLNVRLTGHLGPIPYFQEIKK